MTSCLALAAFAGSASATIVFSDDFESPDVTAAQSDGFTSGAINTSNWVKASNGFGSGRQGTVDEAHGDFTDPVGEQAYAFRYTNSGITSVVGAILGTGNTFGDFTSDSSITVTFDVVIDGHNIGDPEVSGTPYDAALVSFADGVARDDMNGGTFSLADGPSAILSSASGNAIAEGDLGYLDYQQVSFSFLFSDLVQDGTVANSDDIALRIYGATNTAIIDNVSIDANLTAVPEPSAFALLAGCFGLAWVMVRRRG